MRSQDSRILVKFLQDLCKKLEDGSISDKERKSVLSFYLKSKCVDEVDITDKMIMESLFLGYCIKNIYIPEEAEDI